MTNATPEYYMTGRNKVQQATAVKQQQGPQQSMFAQQLQGQQPIPQSQQQQNLQMSVGNPPAHQLHQLQGTCGALWEGARK